MRRPVQLGRIQETALVPLYARALVHWFDLDRDHVKRKLAARFAWACEDPVAIQDWGIGLRLVESRTVADVPDGLWPRLPLPLRASLRVLRRFFPKLVNLYRLNLFVAR